MNRISGVLLNNWRILVAFLAVAIMVNQTTRLALRLGHLWTPALSIAHSEDHNNAAQPPPAGDSAALAQLLQSNWWGQAQLQAADAGSHQNTTLPLELKGVFQTLGNKTAMDESGALINQTGQTQLKIYHVGDDLGGGTLVSVGQRDVQIRRPDGHLESLIITQHPPLLLAVGGNSPVSARASRHDHSLHDHSLHDKN